MTLADRLRAALARPIDPLAAVLTGDLDMDDRPDPKRAAVLVAVTDRPEPGVLLTLRHAGLRAHAGQISFPGGRIDPEDAGPIEAALREAQEEIALDPAAVEIVGQDAPYRTGTNYLITPIVGVIPPDLPLRASESEVDAIYEAPLQHLLDPANRVQRVAEWEGRERRYFEIAWEQRVWGATAAMIANLSWRLRDV